MLSDFIVDLLASPPWVIVTFVVVYSLLLAAIVWKISSWYKGISGWNKHRSSEKSWKEKVARLEEENKALQEKLDQSDS